MTYEARSRVESERTEMMGKGKASLTEVEGRLASRGEDVIYQLREYALRRPSGRPILGRNLSEARSWARRMLAMKERRARACGRPGRAHAQDRRRPAPVVRSSPKSLPRHRNALRRSPCSCAG